MPSPITEQSRAAFRATVCIIPAQLGRLTLYQAAELSDAVNNVRTCCAHAFQYETGQAMPDHFAQRLTKGMRRGDIMTLAKAARVLSLWYKWTHQHRDFPSLSSVQGFLFALSR